jgi:hypothetical protein
MLLYFYWSSNFSQNDLAGSYTTINCSAHKLPDNEMKELERKNIFIKFLPPNLTSKRQPADMVMIASLKVGYKSLMLNELLDLFDEGGGFETEERM